MKLPSLIVAASLSVFCLATASAEPTAPVDLTQRNRAFVPGDATRPEGKTPESATTFQDRRVEISTVAKIPAAVGERRAAITVQETTNKVIRDTNASRPQVVEQAVSTFNRRSAPITTASDATQPPVVSKYQDSLKAASATNMARFPALDRATTLKLNRFVFRKNAPEPEPITGHAPVTPAGGSATSRN